ncbi:MAG: efflux RND transporter periplasmic adaptor subunit [Acidobacteriota bacterium]
MSGKRGWIGLVVLAVAVLGTLAVWRIGRRAGGPAEEEVVSEVPVRVGKLGRTTLRRFVETFGTVEATPAEPGRPAGGARVAAAVTGTVAAVTCAEGQRVARGDELVRLDARVADARVARAREAVGFARLTVERQKAMSAAAATSRREEQDAEAQLAAAQADLAAAEAERALLDIKAPLAGTVVRLNTRPGEAVDPSVALVELVDLDRLVVAAGVRADEAARVKVGQGVELLPAGAGAASPGDATRVVGHVVYVSPAVDPSSGTVGVRVAVPAGSRLAPGEYVDLRIVAETRRDCLVVPVDALVCDDQGNNEIAVVDGDHAVLTRVKAGVREGGMVEVEGDGLREGMTIVTEGAYGMPKESKIRVLGS